MTKREQDINAILNKYGVDKQYVLQKYGIDIDKKLREKQLAKSGSGGGGGGSQQQTGGYTLPDF